MKDSIQHAVAADHVFDGAVVHKDAAVVIEGFSQLQAGIAPEVEPKLLGTKTE
jgi:hypothetical protein